MTITLEIKLPPDVNLSEFEMKMTIAAGLFNRGEILSKEAAELAGISETEFLKTFRKYSVSMYQ